MRIPGASQRDTEPIPAIPAFDEATIARELTHWHGNLTKAKANGDILATNTALHWLDVWLDRKNTAAAV